MRLVFAGTPDAAIPSLRVLAASGHEIAAVITRTDAPVGRKRVLTPSPVAQTAAGLGLPVLKTDRLDDDAAGRITALRPHLGVVVAYGALVREPLLSAPTHGWINLHFSLLPRWRGAAPVQRALIAGETTTGASVFRLVPELDAGDVLDEVPYEIPPHATAVDVLDALSRSGADLLARTVDAIAASTATATPQRGTSTYAPKLTAEDGRIDWAVPARAVLDRIRGTTPEPGAFTTIDGARVKVLEAHRADTPVALTVGHLRAEGRSVLVGTATDPIALVRVQPAGKGPMDAADWWRGVRSDDPRAGS